MSVVTQGLLGGRKGGGRWRVTGGGGLGGVGEEVSYAGLQLRCGRTRCGLQVRLCQGGLALAIKLPVYIVESTRLLALPERSEDVSHAVGLIPTLGTGLAQRKQGKRPFTFLRFIFCWRRACMLDN